MSAANHRDLSEHEIRVCIALRDGGDRWRTAAAIAEAAEVAPRTARLHLSRLTDAGIAQCLRLTNGFRYRWSEAGARTAQSYMVRVLTAAQALAQDSPEVAAIVFRVNADQPTS